VKQINVTGIIGWDTTAEDVREQLQTANGEDIEAIISSPGGLVSEGLDIFNQFRNYKGHRIARLSGFAMSMASYIPLAFDHIIAEDNAVFMIHNVSGGVWGDHNEILSFGAFVKSLSGLLCRAYVKRSGIESDEIAAMMDSETYLFGKEIVERGFADEVIDASDSGDSDNETAMAMARLAFEECSAKLNQDTTAIKEDMRLAAQMINPPVGAQNKPGKPNRSEPANKGTVIMTLEELKANHPDLVAALVAEAIIGMITAEDLQAQIKTAHTEAATAEAQRIQDVEAQAIAGQEKLIATLKFDGKTTGPEAAVQVLAAVKADQSQHLQNMRGDAPDPLKPSGDGGDGDPAASGTDDEKAKAAWEKSEDLQSEFGGNFEAYAAFKRAESSGRARVLKK